MEKIGYKAIVLLSFLILQLWTANVADGFVPRSKVPAIFGFGDSLIDAGNNNFIENSTVLANYLPYGESFFHRATGRWTNGRLAFDFIAARLGLPFMPPFLKPGVTFEHGVNFASAGSGILNTTGLGEGVDPLAVQVSQFQQIVEQLTSELGPEAAGNFTSKSLFFFVSGSNDLSAYLRNSTLQEAVTPTQYVTTVLSELETYVETVYSLGARKLVFLGIGPLGCAPEVMAAANGTNGNCIAAPNELALVYNGGLLTLVEGLNSKLPNLHAVMVNYFDKIENLVNNGTGEGFTGGSNACCGSGPFNGAVRCGPNHTTSVCENVGNFVFWDILHPTQRVHRLIARFMWAGDSSFIQPVNLKDLVEL